MTSGRATAVLRHVSRVNKIAFQAPPIAFSRLRSSAIQCCDCTRSYISLHNSSCSTRLYLSRPSLRSAEHLSRRTVFIQTTPTPNDNALKFIPTEHSILPSTSPTVEFLSSSPNVPSPLARSLLAIPGVRSVMFSPEFLTVEKEEDANWSHIKPEVFSLTMEHLLSGKPVLTENTDHAADTRIEEGDSETVQMIKELLETRIRPAIMEDGGDIEYRGFENGEVLLKLRGACRTCDSSVVTLKNGIEVNIVASFSLLFSGIRLILGDDETLFTGCYFSETGHG